MTSKNRAFESKKAELTQIPRDAVKRPNMPMGTYIQEANNLYHWCCTDQEALEGAGLDWSLAEDLPVRTDATSEAQSIWHNAMRDREDAERTWRQAAPEAEALRDELIHTMRYGYRDDESLLGRVASVVNGTGDADFIQDLNDLSVIGRENPEPLLAVGAKQETLELAGEWSKQLGALKAAATSDKASGRSAKLQRDRAFTHLKEAVDTIRACGQYVFWRDETRATGYASEYQRTNRKARAAARKSDQSTHPVPVAETDTTPEASPSLPLHAVPTV